MKLEKIETGQDAPVHNRENVVSKLEPDRYGKEQVFSSSEIEKLKVDDINNIERICLQIDKEKISSSNDKNAESLSKNHIEIVNIEGKQYSVEYVPKEDIYPAYGYGGGNRAVVRQDLSPRVKKFVKAHELYHCQDKSYRGGWLRREIRANLIPGMKDPLGLIATIWKTISDKDRINFYLKRIKDRQ